MFDTSEFGGGISDLFGNGSLTTPLASTGNNDLLGWGSLGYGGFRAFKTKRVNLMTLGLILFGMWRLGMISNIIPTNKDGSINWIMIAIAAVLPPTAAALIGGAPALVVSTLMRTVWKRRRRYVRRFRSYRRRWRSYRPRYYRRRRAW